jgi:hypothetical protein
VPEIIENGVTGIIVDTLEEAITALPQVIALDRRKVRLCFEQRFSATRMATDYVKVYQSLIASSHALHKSMGIASSLFEGMDRKSLGSQLA